MTTTFPSTSVSHGLSFDKIAHAYDDYNLHPPEVARKVGAEIAAITGPSALVLELGIGTARIATPVADAGCRVIGLDLSSEMLNRAQQKGFTRLLRGDLTQLPLTDNSVDAVLFVHVLHHIKDWRTALAEAARIIRPGGVLIQGTDWTDPESCVGFLRSMLRQAVLDLRPGIRPPGAGAPIAQVLGKLGGTTGQEQIAASWTIRSTPATVIQRMASRVHQETWPLDDELLAAALERVRAAAAARWPDLEQEQSVERRFLLTATRF